MVGKSGQAQSESKPKSAPPVPNTLRQARLHKDAVHWEAAYNREVSMHNKFGTLRLVDETEIAKGSMIAKPVLNFTHKQDSKGNATGYKVRASNPGNRLIPGLHCDPHAVVAYAADRDSIRLLLVMSVNLNLKAYHLDMTSAFIHKDYEGLQRLYMTPFHDFHGNIIHRGKVGIFHKNIYGTPNVPHTYAKGLLKHLRTNGYNQLWADRNVYVRQTGNDFPIMAVTIDDFCVITKSKKLYKELVQMLKTKYRVKELRLAKSIIGWTITRDKNSNSIHISQPNLAKAFVAMLKMQRAATAKTPYPYSVKLHKKLSDEEILDLKVYPYAKAVGILRYLVDSTRPDLAYIVGVLARNVKHPTQRHWAVLKHVARYIQGTITHGPLYAKGDMNLSAQSDADFAGCKDSRQSTYAGLLYYGKSLVSCCSRRIKSVATSLFESEYIAASNVAHHVRWMRTLLQELPTPRLTATTLKIDN